MMEYPQITYFEDSGAGELKTLMSDSFNPDVVYNQLDASGHIFCKVDWVTMIFTDCCMMDVLKWLHLEKCISDFIRNMFEVSRGYSDVVKFVYNGIVLETNKFSFYGDQPEDVFDVVVPKLRLELSGSGLDFLRSLGVEMNVYRFNRPNLPEGSSYHFSRIDFAYDFIDYQPTFLDELIEHCNKHQLPSGRVPLASTHGAIKCKIVTGDRKVCYLGSEQSDKFLRVYDKRLQCINRVTGTYVKSNPYGNPDSWIRVEWQLRNLKAHDLALDDTQDFKTILKHIFDSYSMADGNRDSHTHKRAVVDFWLRLFPWREVESRIVQKANFVKVESADARVINSFENIMLRNFMFYVSLLGREEVEKRCNAYLRDMFTNQCDVAIRRLSAFRCRLNELSIADKLPDESDLLASGLIISKGVLQFRW